MRLFIFLLVFFFASDLGAQGIHFSDNREIPIQLNPAFTGVIHNEYVHRFVLAHRRQGNAVLGENEFETSYLSYDRKLSLCEFADDMFIGLGIELLHDQVGVSFGSDKQFFHRQEANFNTSLGLKLFHGTHLVIGLRTGLLSHGLSDDNLTYDSQFDGRDFDGSIPTGESFLNDRLFYFDLGTGVLLRGTFNSVGGNRILQLKTYELGISFMHINNKENRFLTNSVEVELAKEFRVHAKVDLLLSGVKMTPSLILYKYGALGSRGKEWQVRPSLEFPILKKIMIAGGMRISNFAENGSNLDTLVFTLKWKPYKDIRDLNKNKDSIIIGLALDVNVSPQLAQATNGYGAFELFFAKYLRGSKNTKVCCRWSKDKNQVFY